MAVYRLRKLWPEYERRVRIAWRALSLEAKNSKSTPKNIVDVEIPLMAQQEVEPLHLDAARPVRVGRRERPRRRTLHAGLGQWTPAANRPGREPSRLGGAQG